VVGLGRLPWRAAGGAESVFELVLSAPEALVEALSQALLDQFAARSVSVEDAQAGSADEQALFGEPGLPPPREGWPQSLLSALFDTEAQAVAAAAGLLAQDWSKGLKAIAMRPLNDQDWVRLTQSQFAPVAITPRFWIVPSWHQPPATARQIIRIDPGLAFGTGTHATTRMCLRWIAAHGADAHARWPRVLDYGCGSGILAIGAAIHGAQRIDAVDIDAAAVEVTRINALANAVTLNCGTPDMARGTYALVLANILATPLQLLAPLLCSHVAPGGDLVLAGMLGSQSDQLRAAYAPWIAIAVQDECDGWVLMAGRRAA
jgi:ribosomal protein L11 methyltransferase